MPYFWNGSDTSKQNKKKIYILEQQFSNINAVWYKSQHQTPTIARKTLPGVAVTRIKPFDLRQAFDEAGILYFLFICLLLTAGHCGFCILLAFFILS